MLHLETVESTTLELLIRLQGLNSLKETRLVGGTALSLQYGHRISVDLDLFVHSTTFNFLEVIAEINNLGLRMEIRNRSITQNSGQRHQLEERKTNPITRSKKALLIMKVIKHTHII